MNKSVIGMVVSVLVLALFMVANPAFAKEHSKVVQELEDLYNKNPGFKEMMDKALANVVPLPGKCPKTPTPTSNVYCWPAGERFEYLLDFFDEWSTFTPSPDNGMLYYKIFYNMCLDNNYALAFVESGPGLGWTRKFVEARGAYMDSEVSIKPDIMDEWKRALGDEWNDYIIPGGGSMYRTFNEFFARELKPEKKRPVAPGDNILAASADTLVNMINSNLTAQTEIPTKYDETLNVAELLNGSPFAEKFIGGTAISGILLPTVYHHFHSPVEGEVVESNGNVNGIFFGMGGKFPTFVNNGNIGGYKSTFGIFGIYQRGYFIIKTKDHGYVGMVAVGLDDISSVNFENKYDNISSKDKSVPVKKGTKLGHFKYGGSLNILLFEKGVFSGLNVLQGQGIGPLKPTMNAVR